MYVSPWRFVIIPILTSSVNSDPFFLSFFVVMMFPEMLGTWCYGALPLYVSPFPSPSAPHVVVVVVVCDTNSI